MSAFSSLGIKAPANASARVSASSACRGGRVSGLSSASLGKAERGMSQRNASNVSGGLGGRASGFPIPFSYSSTRDVSSRAQVEPTVNVVPAAGAEAAEVEPEEEEVVVLPDCDKPVVKVKLSVYKQVEFGEHVCVVGAGERLGSWNTDSAVPMDCDLESGTHWTVELDVPAWEMLEYKYVIRSGWSPGAGCRWQAGPNSILATNSHARLEVEDHFFEPGSEFCSSMHPMAPLVEKAATAAVAAYTAAAPTLPPPPKEQVESSDATSLLPEWARGATFYQIYPLGFFGAPMYNDGTGETIPRLEKMREYYGYLEDLGVEAVYFSPLFESETHGYDTTDYFKIDRRLGDVELFREIVQELQARGIRVVLDGVFNHTGRTHFAFKDIQDKGPARSEFSSWYHVGARSQDYPGWCTLVPAEDGIGFAYDCWEGHDLLPRLELSEPAVREHLFEVARYWLEDVGIDGWRLDVAHEISPAFWRDFRKVCQAVKPDCLLVGELIHGNYNNWLGPDLLHSGTNYQQSKAIWSSLKDRNYHELVHCMLREDQLYGELELLNFVGNHDVPRIANVLDDPRHYALAAAFLLTQKGMPCLYYGDELGMEGTPDGPDGDDAMRRPMPSADNSALDWPERGGEILYQTKQLCAIRRANPALRHGSFDAKNMVNTDEQFGFIRRHPLQVAVMLFNCSGYPQQMQMPVPGVADGTVMRDQIETGVEFVVRGEMLHQHPAPEHGPSEVIHLPECSCRILVGLTAEGEKAAGAAVASSTFPSGPGTFPEGASSSGLATKSPPPPANSPGGVTVAMVTRALQAENAAFDRVIETSRMAEEAAETVAAMLEGPGEDSPEYERAVQLQRDATALAAAAREEAKEEMTLRESLEKSLQEQRGTGAE